MLTIREMQGELVFDGQTYVVRVTQAGVTIEGMSYDSLQMFVLAATAKQTGPAVNKPTVVTLDGAAAPKAPVKNGTNGKNGTHAPEPAPTSKTEAPPTGNVRIEKQPETAKPKAEEPADPDDEPAPAPTQRRRAPAAEEPEAEDKPQAAPSGRGFSSQFAPVVEDRTAAPPTGRRRGQAANQVPEEGPASTEALPEDVRTAGRLMPVIQHLMDVEGLRSLDTLVARCEALRDTVPLLQRIQQADLQPRVQRTMAMLGQEDAGA